MKHIRASLAVGAVLGAGRSGAGRRSGARRPSAGRRQVLHRLPHERWRLGEAHGGGCTRTRVHRRAGSGATSAAATSTSVDAGGLPAAARMASPAPLPRRTRCRGPVMTTLRAGSGSADAWAAARRRLSLRPMHTIGDYFGPHPVYGPVSVLPEGPQPEADRGSRPPDPSGDVPLHRAGRALRPGRRPDRRVPARRGRRRARRRGRRPRPERRQPLAGGCGCASHGWARRGLLRTPGPGTRERRRGPRSRRSRSAR